MTFYSLELNKTSVLLILSGRVFLSHLVKIRIYLQAWYDGIKLFLLFILILKLWTIIIIVGSCARYQDFQKCIILFNRKTHL